MLFCRGAEGQHSAPVFDIIPRMIDWLQVRYWVNGLALLAVLLMPVLMVFASAERAVTVEVIVDGRVQ